MVDLTKLAFNSKLNYLKRHNTISGSRVVSLSSGNDEEIVINHNLGYIPFHTVGFNLSDPDIIWSTNTTKRNINASAITPGGPIVRYYCDDTDLTIEILNNNVASPVNGNRTIYYVIYLDYENA